MKRSCNVGGEKKGKRRRISQVSSGQKKVVSCKGRLTVADPQLLERPGDIEILGRTGNIIWVKEKREGEHKCERINGEERGKDLCQETYEHVTRGKKKGWCRKKGRRGTS